MLNLCCSICEETIEAADEIHSTTCGHIFHNHCLQQWLQRSDTCPQCRNQCTTSNTHRIYFNLENSENISRDIESLQLEIMNKTDIIDNKEKRIEELEIRLAEKESLINSHLEEILSKREMLENKETRIQYLEQIRAENDTEITEYSLQIMNKTDIINNNEKTIKDLITDMKEKDSLLKKYWNEVKDKKMMLEEKQRKIQDLEVDKEEKDFFIKSISKQIEEKLIVIDCLQEEVKIWKNINMNFQESLDSLINRLNDESKFTKSDLIAAPQTQDKEHFEKLRTFYGSSKNV